MLTDDIFGNFCAVRDVEQLLCNSPRLAVSLPTEMQGAPVANDHRIPENVHLGVLKVEMSFPFSFFFAFFSTI